MNTETARKLVEFYIHSPKFIPSLIWIFSTSSLMEIFEASYSKKRGKLAYYHNHLYHHIPSLPSQFKGKGPFYHLKSTIIYLHKPSTTIIGNHLPSWTILGNHLPSWTFIAHHLPSWTFIPNHLPSWAFIDHHPHSWTFIGHHPPS